MLLGHYGAAFAVKAADRRLSLGTLFIASNFPDIVWSILLLCGAERTAVVPGFTKWVPLKGEYAPFSHGMAGVFGLAAAFALCARIFGALRRNKFPDARAAALLGALVFSHILLDVPVHAKEIPLFGMDSTLLGFGLWNYPAVSNAIELGILAAGIALYLTLQKAGFRKALPVMLFGLLLTAYHFLNGFVPPPAGMSAKMIALSVLAGILVFSAIAVWIDRRFFLESQE